MKNVRLWIIAVWMILPHISEAQVLLKTLGAGKGVAMGAAVTSELLMGSDGSNYPNLVTQHYSSITAEWELKMEPLQRVRGVFDFTAANRIVNFAQNNRQKVHGHALVWEISVPSWFHGLTNAQKLTEMRNHIFVTVKHFKDNFPGVVNAWDVVNEAVASNGTLRTNVFSSIGSTKDAYIRAAFRRAHEADPRALLYYNDFNIERAGVKQDGVFQLLRTLKNLGVPVHGLGIQGHLSTDQIPPSIAELRATIRRFATLGLKIKFTELDVRVRSSDGITAAETDRANRSYFNVVRACALEPACVGVTTWGFTNKHTYIWSSHPGYSPRLPFGMSYQRTDMFNSIVNALSF